MRNSKKFDGKVERRPPPHPKSVTETLEQLQNVGYRLPGKHEQFGGKKRKRQPLELNWTKRSIFWDLPYWASLSVRHNLDVMHIEKNVCEALLGTILNIDGKSKDTDKARIDLQNMGIRKELHLYKDDDRWMKPHAPYTLSTTDCRKFCEFLKSIRFPDGFASNLKKNITDTNTKIAGLKSHDCHVILQRLLPTGIRPFMKKEIVDAITELSNFFQLICSRTLRVSDLEKARDDIVLILCKLETIFPPAFFDIMVHLVLHLPDEAICGGPVHLRWMYPVERFLGSLKKYVRNRARPEGSIAEAYIVNEALTFCSLYLRRIETRFNRPERNWVDDDIDHVDNLSVFAAKIRPIGKMIPTMLENDLRVKAEWYILQNCSEIQSYIDEHIKSLEDGGNRHPFDAIQARTFRSWFSKKIHEFRQRGLPEATDQIVSLSSGASCSVRMYSGCIVNGVKFLTYNRDKDRTTQNSGICVRGQDNQVFYGVLEEIFELSYINNNSVFLFKCKWFDTRAERKRIQRFKNRTSIFIRDAWYENEPFVLASQAEQVFYLDDLYNGPNWRVVEHFGHRHIWDFPEELVDDVTVVQDNESRNVDLVVELPELDTLQCPQPDVAAHSVTSNVHTYLLDKSAVEDEFIEDDDEELVFEDINSEAEFTQSEDDEDVDSIDDVENISSDDD